MRKLPRLLLVATVVALVATPLTTAEAASSRSSRSVHVKGKDKLIDVSSESRKLRRTTISGHVSGGSASGMKVRLYATNRSLPKDDQKAIHLKDFSVGSSGKFSRSFAPSRGGEWRITARLVKGDKVLDTAGTTLDAFHWSFLYEFPAVESSDQGVEGPLLKPDPKWKIRTKWYGESTYLVHGGSRITFDTRGYKCKKINFKAGVENHSRVKKGSFRISQPARNKDAHRILSARMKRGQKAYDAINHRKVRDRMRTTRQLEIRVFGSSNLKFLFGNTKVFCTFPSTND